MTEIESTKAKILETSTKLFADKGFARTSIREIASLCDVNIAAINYHFGSKQNLCIQVFENAYRTTDEQIHILFKKSKTIEDLAVQYFDYLTQEHVLLKSLFRIILSPESEDVFNILHENHKDIKQQDGPPGIQFFIKKLEENHKDHKNIEFAAKTIMANITHFALIYSSAKTHIGKRNKSYFKLKTLRENIKLHAQILNKYGFEDLD